MRAGAPGVAAGPSAGASCAEARVRADARPPDGVEGARALAPR